MQKGDLVDRYRLDERLGAGAFGEVWKACQLADGEDVGVICAIKVMKVAQDRSESSARGFASGWLDEVRNLVRVAGETIPRILEANVWNDHAYIAMELLDGDTLATRLASGSIPWRRALFIADQIAKALEAGHQVGVVHRDLKPQNVVITGANRVCVIDWGIASLNAARSPASGVERRAVVDVEMTDAEPVAAVVTPRQRPVPIGTPGYMAPEVYDGALPAAGQDVFALGIVLYEMISGRLPQSVERLDRSSASPDSVKAYRGSLDKATMDYAFVPLGERCPDVPIGVIQLVESLLARDPERRPQRLRNAIDLAGRFPHGVPDPPYAGLVKLGPERAGLYFGQQDTIQHVLDRLRSQRGVLLWGPSGSGKSSLALAGVAATMDRSLFAETDGWTIHVIRPREGAGLRIAAATTPPSGSTLGHVVVIDQLEEVVDLAPEDQEPFCAAILALLQRSGPVSVRGTAIGMADEVRVVATIRADLEWLVDHKIPALRPLLERRIIVKGVDANFARSIIEEPARALGYEVEGIEAVSREVEERLSADAAKLPVVQYALSEWWERRDEQRKVLPRAAWQELGGVDGALSFVAERFFAPLDAERQARVKALFILMFLGERKQPVVESALAPADRALVEELTRLRLVGRREKQGSAPFYEVEHESLAKNWNRLADWLAEARDDRVLAEELERDATAYVRDDDSHRLWKKGRLASATEMAQRGRIVLSASATRFLSEAGRQARRSRIVQLTSIGVALAILLGAGYAVVLTTAASGERDQAMVELGAAVADREAARLEVERAKSDRLKLTTDLEAASARLREAETLVTEAKERTRELEARTRELERVMVEATKATDAANKAKEAALREQAIVKAICPGGARYQ